MSRIAFIGSLFILAGHLTVAQVTFIIESLPGATPTIDTIFVCGNFNEWKPNDPRYAVHRQPNGQLAVTVPLVKGPLEYKFTRGSWTKVETSAENHYIDNRIFLSHRISTVFIRIDNWLDLGGAKRLNYIIFYFFACAFQCMALCLFVYAMRKKDEGKMLSFLIVNVIFTGLLVLLIAQEIANPIGQSYLAFLFQIGLFFWGPLLLYFFLSFFWGSSKRLYFNFIPGGIASLFIVARILNIDSFNFMSSWIDTFLLTSGFIFNVVVYTKMWRQFSFLKNPGKTEHDHKTSFISYFFWTSFTALLLLPVNFMLISMGIKIPFINGFHSIAVVLSTLIFMETYFLWRYAEIFREEKIYSSLSEDSLNWIERLNTLMNDVKPYKKPDLSISELADMLGTKPHILSKVINDSYHKNFRDFVNNYRIQEFIALANTKQFRHYTFLALAEEVGFNSKSTFNLAFKKLTHQSPRAYFKNKALS
jgi:AraC-like DNA-binding protein